ncbi:formate dehydrogenase accessory sulfurtransferase FdhD [Parasphingorhabdus cellanae]|uniref:Sulfur carrier protein FdhD n=1 Tax=Parasphingorhabdus cellanae TaxID=2806553 RepID=A0ABX7T3Y4_9SPHN|nr:formate dehydrogenase accessory sulfurtransferase FdhD [Parasphingorhabdus cellanae]QTD55841.1 formate dehydrogenase accessory sulfurtransferase FdhD [Parasphingorhabdus cellanae]
MTQLTRSKAQRFIPSSNLPELIDRDIAVEEPVSIEFNGIGYAVMMATPSDLQDFIIGFAINERLIDHKDQLGSIDIVKLDKGTILRANLIGEKADIIFERARTRVAESSCGLCGLENLELVAQKLPKVVSHQFVEYNSIFRALQNLHNHQPINDATGGVHAAAWVDRQGNIGLVREDVGRHNALDKLVGRATIEGIDLSIGFILTTSRCSYEIVEKTAIAGGTTLVTISVPTSFAIERARSCGLSLVSLARPDSLLQFN